jgi:hypothetical protein
MKHSLIALFAASLPLAACIVRPADNCNDYGSPCSTGAGCDYGTGGANYPSGNPGQPAPPPPSKQDAGTTMAYASDAGGVMRGPYANQDAGAGAAAQPGQGDAGSGSKADAGSSVATGPDATAALPCNDAGTCGKPTQTLCTYNHECGAGGRCSDGECQRPCTTSSNCGTGDTCQAGFCQPASTAGSQCLYASDCSAGSQCINGYCHTGCKVDSDCPNRADACTSSLCRPDGRPTPQCRSNSDCTLDRECVNAVCRTPCDSDQNCGLSCSGTVCKSGFCVEPQEVTPVCTRNASCSAGQVCIDAICT